MSDQDQAQDFTILSTIGLNLASLPPVTAATGMAVGFAPQSFAVITVPTNTTPHCVHGNGCVFTLLFSSVYVPLLGQNVDIYFVHCPYGPPCP